MESKILEVLDKYENIPADYSFVKDVLSILRKEYHAEEYLKKIIPYSYFNQAEKNSNWDGFYDDKNKAIFIQTSSCDNFNVSRLEKNIFILVLILHEFTHVRQSMNMDNNSFESKLLKISNMVPLNAVLEDVHDLIPSERLANIFAEISCIKILSMDFFRYQNEIYRRKKILYYYFLNGYKLCNNGDIISPLEQYFRGIELSADYIDLLKIDVKEYSLAKRLLYGLNINKDEYDSLKDTYGYYSNKVNNKNKLRIKIL